jgi:hypothetical protein
MTSPLLASAALVLLLGLGAGTARADQGGLTLQAPAPKPAATMNTADRQAETEAARLCATIKDDTAETACLDAHAKTRAAEKAAAARRAQTVPAPDPNQSAACRASPIANPAVEWAPAMPSMADPVGEDGPLARPVLFAPSRTCDKLAELEYLSCIPIVYGESWRICGASAPVLPPSGAQIISTRRDALEPISSRPPPGKIGDAP